MTRHYRTLRQDGCTCGLADTPDHLPGCPVRPFVAPMTDPTTRVRAILDAATPGPLRASGATIWKPTGDGTPTDFTGFAVAWVALEAIDEMDAPDGRAIALSRNLLPAALDVVEAARRREKAEEALTDWDTLHGYVINAERDALANDRGEAIYRLRAALDAYDAKVQETQGS